MKETGKFGYADPKTLYVEEPSYDGPPSLICTICGAWDRPEASFGYRYAWFCPECEEKLRKLVKGIEMENK